VTVAAGIAWLFLFEDFDLSRFRHEAETGCFDFSHAIIDRYVGLVLTNACQFPLFHIRNCLFEVLVGGALDSLEGTCQGA